LDSFRLAGWSRDPDGKLDARRIRVLRLGWGGHPGQAGERIGFALEEINLLRLK
jgi:hypothetical protein